MIKKFLVKYMGYRYIYLISYVKSINNGTTTQYSNMLIVRTKPIGLIGYKVTVNELKDEFKDSVIIAISYLNFEKYKEK